MIDLLLIRLLCRHNLSYNNHCSISDNKSQVKDTSTELIDIALEQTNEIIEKV